MDRARAFGEQHQLAAGLQVRHAAADHAARRLVADVARQPRAGAEERVAHQTGPHDADAARHARDHQQRVEHARMVGRDDQAAVVVQHVERGVVDPHQDDREARRAAGEAAVDRRDRRATDDHALMVREQRVEHEADEVPGQRHRAEVGEQHVEQHALEGTAEHGHCGSSTGPLWATKGPRVDLGRPVSPRGIGRRTRRTRGCH